MSSSKQKAGRRRDLIRVQRHNGNTRAGEHTLDVENDWDTFSSMATLPAEVLGVTGGEEVRGLQMENNTTYLVTISSTERTRSILPTDRFKYRNLILNINRIIDRTGSNRDLVIQCTHRVLTAQAIGKGFDSGFDGGFA